MLRRVRGNLTGARSAGTGHLAWRYTVFIHTDHWTLSLIFICCSNLFRTIVTACKVHVNHNVSCALVVLMTADSFAFVWGFFGNKEYF